MTLFVKIDRPNGYLSYEISDLYIMLGFSILSYTATYLILKQLKRRYKNRQQRRNVPKFKQPHKHFRGGVEWEAVQILLQCVEDHKNYQVIDPFLAKILRSMIAEGFRKQSYIISQRLARYLALRLSEHKGGISGIILQVRNAIFFTDNYGRLLTRIVFSGTIGLITGVATTIIGTVSTALPYAILMIILSFDVTTDCGVNCSQHLLELPSGRDTIEVLVEREKDTLIIASNDQAHQVQTYTPEENLIEIIEKGQTRKFRPYTKTKRKAKLVKFSDKKKQWENERSKVDTISTQNPAFKDMEDASYVPRRKCKLKEIQEIDALE